MTKEKTFAIEVLREEGTQPFVTGGVLRGKIVLAGFTSAIRLGPSSFRACKHHVE